MSTVWDTLIKIEEYFEESFNKTGEIDKEPELEQLNHPLWTNKVWVSESYRRAHISVVDARLTKGLWMMHCCVFPHIHNPSPIFGFDVVAGKNKITGCFHDFSPAGNNNHELIQWFKLETEKLTWTKKRILPRWAQEIFSPSIVAAGNINVDSELDQIYGMAKHNLDHYLSHVGQYNYRVNNTTEIQNFYCSNQKQNPHTPKVMSSLGLGKESVNFFIEYCLFPEIKEPDSLLPK